MRTVSKKILLGKVISTLTEAQLPETQARIVAQVLVDADASGVHSHGVIRLPHYIERISQGGINTDARFLIEDARFPWARCIDAEGGFGHVAAMEAVLQGEKVSAEHGIAMVAVKNTSHCGMLGFYVREAARRNLISFMCANTDKCVVPFGGKNSFFGTNPFAWGFPQGEEREPIVVDMATSAKSLGAVFTARDEGDAIPKEWAVDAHGIPTDDPRKVKSLLPMAAHKGYALAFVVETLAAILTGSAFGPHLVPMYDDLHRRRDLSAFFLFFSPGIYQNASDFSHQLSQMVAELRMQEQAPDVESVQVPGDRTSRKRQEAEKGMVSVVESAYAFLGFS